MDFASLMHCSNLKMLHGVQTIIFPFVFFQQMYFKTERHISDGFERRNECRPGRHRSASPDDHTSLQYAGRH